MTVSELLGFITSYDLCNGLDIKQRCYPDSVMNHVIPCELDLNLPSSSLSTPQNVKEFKRENRCYILVSNNNSPCLVCSICIKKLDSKFKKQNINESRPCKPNAPLSKTNPNKMRLAIMQGRLKCCAQLDKDLTRMKNEIKVPGVSVSGEVSNDMLNIFNQNENKAIPFMKLFWEQQKNFYI